MKRLFFVMNPYAGTRKANRHLTDILTVFNRAGYEVTAYMTAGTGDAVQAVASHAADVDAVVCCGGDGTFNETISGILQSGADVPVGYIPAGSTNDFASSLGLPLHPLEAAKYIVDGVPYGCDMGQFGQRYFSYVASFGAFTRTSYATPQNVKNALGHTAYVLGGIQELGQLHTVHVRLELDGETVEDDFLFGAICNSTSVGGVLTLDPKQVDMSDGKFEVLLVRTPKDLAELGECIQAVQKQVYNCNMVTFRSASHIVVTADPAMPWTLDGEREEGHDQVEVSNLHNAIWLLRREEAQ